MAIEVVVMYYDAVCDHCQLYLHATHSSPARVRDDAIQFGWQQHDGKWYCPKCYDDHVRLYELLDMPHEK